MTISLKKLGPGLLFAGAAIGVSHLVQSTRAGANFGFGLVWALLLVNLFKYPFFQYGPRYALATGESLLDGYKKLGKGVLWTYFILSLGTMFTIQTAVTIVTADIANTLFNGILSREIWTVIILLICSAILIIGKYNLLDKLMKVIIITLSIATLLALITATLNNTTAVDLKQILPKNTLELSFLIAFMGWMPAPLDISVWHSLWALEKKKKQKSFKINSAIFDFNIGYITTIVLGLGFIGLGAMVMFQSGEPLSVSASDFSNQLISVYTSSLGAETYIIIGCAALTTMFSTTLTTLDASPRSMAKTVELLFKNTSKHLYLTWLSILVIGSILIFFFLNSELGFLVQVATVLSFLTAPFYALSNYILLSSKHTPKAWQPSFKMHIL
ncbi:MAG: Nramp family divalent metal transporter, partial [Winogradskyella sp.]|nr:Nramp family divalent metal transporter [Winogradskyella sp.]